MKTWKSIAFWDPIVGVMDDKSSDEHETKEAAESVCRMLSRDGFGGEGKHFPNGTMVMKIKKDKIDIKPLLYLPLVMGDTSDIFMTTSSRRFPTPKKKLICGLPGCGKESYKSYCSAEHCNKHKEN